MAYRKILQEQAHANQAGLMPSISPFLECTLLLLCKDLTHDRKASVLALIAMNTSQWFVLLIIDERRCLCRCDIEAKQTQQHGQNWAEQFVSIRNRSTCGASIMLSRYSNKLPADLKELLGLLSVAALLRQLVLKGAIICVPAPVNARPTQVRT